MISNVLPKLGFSHVVRTGGPNDKGCDALAVKDEDYAFYKYCIQIKRYESTRRVGVDDLREVLDGIDVYKCDKGLIITTSGFSPEVIVRAKSKNVELIDGIALENIIQKYGISVPLIPAEEHVKVHKKEEGESSVTKVKDDGIYFPISVSEALDRAKNKIAHLGEPKLSSITIIAKRLYIFSIKASFKVPGKGRRSLSLKKAMSIDGKEISPDNIILEKSTVGRIKYITNKEKFLKIKEEVKQRVISELPSNSEDIRIKEESVKKCWIASSIEFTFDIGYTKARVTIGDKEEVTVEPLTLEQVRKITNAEKIEKIPNGWKCYRTDDKYEYEIILNEVGIIKQTMRRIKRSIALELTKEIGNVLEVKEGAEGYLITLDNGKEVKECYVKDVNDVMCKTIGIGSKTALEISEKDFTNFMYAQPTSYNIVYDNGWKVLLISTTGKCEYIVSLDGKFIVNREINENYCKAWLASKFTDYVVKRNGNEIVGVGTDGNFNYSFVWDLKGNLKQTMKRINKDYAVKLVKTRLGVEGNVRTLEVNDGVKIDILSGNIHYLFKVNNEGKIVKSLNVMEISAFIGKNNIIDWGYNTTTGKPIIKVDEGNKYSYYFIEGNEFRKVGEEGKGVFSKLMSGFRKVVDPKLRIDTKDVMDLI
ncbi:restriction endonuclease [Acidianus ambivalens]|uniref:restriction endonuclease n=1 Tax=Acidianus ambivalens TaxID=2283 RepID=UPI003182DA12